MPRLRWTILILLCLFVIHGFGKSNSDTLKHHISTNNIRHKPKYPIGRRLSDAHLYYNDCVFNDRYTLSQRLKKYPFVNATKILAVSFNTPRNDEIIVDSTGNPAPSAKPAFIRDGFQVNDGKLFYPSLIEVKELDLSQINFLTGIIYNTKVKIKNRGIVMGYNCFNPRNALVFFDANGKVFDYLEICFECEGYYCPTEKITVGNYCNQKYDLLKKFFLDLGIKTATIYLN